MCYNPRCTDTGTESAVIDGKSVDLCFRCWWAFREGRKEADTTMGVSLYPVDRRRGQLRRTGAVEVSITDADVTVTHERGGDHHYEDIQHVVVSPEEG